MVFKGSINTISDFRIILWGHYKGKRYNQAPSNTDAHSFLGSSEVFKPTYMHVYFNNDERVLAHANLLFIEPGYLSLCRSNTQCMCMRFGVSTLFCDLIVNIKFPWKMNYTWTSDFVDSLNLFVHICEVKKRKEK